MADHIISWMIFLPMIGVFFQPFVKSAQGRLIALISSLSSFFCALGVIFLMKKETSHLQLEESWSWISAYSIEYHIGVDGMNILLVLLIAILFPTLIACEWTRKNSTNGLMSLLLILQTALLGSICAQDLFLQYFFWSLSSLPFYFFTGIWGGQKREQAAFRMLVASVVGNAFLFAALVLVYYSAEPHSFCIKKLSDSFLHQVHFASIPSHFFIFGLFCLGFGLRVPIWPLHGWFYEFAQQAPSSVLIAFCAGVVPVACGLFVRICYFLFPHLLSFAGPWVSTLGLVNLVISVFCAATQKHFRGLLAFICLGQIGFILVGIGSLSLAGLMGAIYQQLMSGLSFAALGLMLGVLSDRMHQDFFEDQDQKKLFGGIAGVAPYLSVACAVGVAGLLGIPGSGNFIGQSLIFFGSYHQNMSFLLIAICVHVFFSAILFRLYQSVFLGASVGVFQENFTDLSSRERGFIFSILSAILFFGIYPKFLVELIRPTILMVLTAVNP